MGTVHSESFAFSLHLPELSDTCLHKDGKITSIPVLPIFAEYNVMVLFYSAGFKFKWHEMKLARWATFPVFFGQVTSAYEGIGTVSISFAFI